MNSNFAFLASKSKLLHTLAISAEFTFNQNPVTTLGTLRQFGEAMAKSLVERFRLDVDPFADQVKRLRVLKESRILQGKTYEAFNMLRVLGNKAIHDFSGTREQAHQALKTAHQLASWYHKNLMGGGVDFKAPSFELPPHVEDVLNGLQSQISRLEGDLTKEKADKSTIQKELEQQKETVAALKSEKTLQDKIDQETKVFDQELEQAAKTEKPNIDVNSFNEAQDEIDLDEAQTRVIIDELLKKAGWEADTQNLKYSNGARPQKGKKLAIAEWPTGTGKKKKPADYVLFSGLTPLAVVEAKRKNKNVAGKIEQAERYSKDIQSEGKWEMAWERSEHHQGPWPAGEEETSYQLPFAYSANGRPYQSAVPALSGIWYRDLTSSKNLPKALKEFHTPDTLERRLRLDFDAAQTELEGYSFEGMSLWPHQEAAIEAVESAIHRGKQEILISMATGTGKTRTVIALIYRLLKSARFKRILFLVDRSLLGEQAHDGFQDQVVDKNKPFGQVYEVLDLDKKEPNDITRVQVATVQGMIHRLFLSEEESLKMDDYDLIIVDEAHRGYTLEREMSKTDEELYAGNYFLSMYRQVIEYFDAVKIGLTATPALHTEEIFGKAVFEYGYKQAVIDGVLVDHDDPIPIYSSLDDDGVTVEGQVEYVTTQGDQGKEVLEDEMKFDISKFNSKIIIPEHTKSVIDALADHLPEDKQGKTLIFCVNDLHADEVVRCLKSALQQRWKNLENDDVMKITGSIEDPSKATKRFKLKEKPKIAVTVDLLTTGVDVRKIDCLVFMRQVKSRILFEQMLGRATRKCPEIGKEKFIIFDAAQACSLMRPFSSMKPVVKNPNLGMLDYVKELQSPHAKEAFTGTNSTRADELSKQLVVKLRRFNMRLQKADKQKKAKQALLDSFKQHFGFTFEDLPQVLAKGKGDKAIELAKDPKLTEFLKRLQKIVSEGQKIYLDPEADRQVTATVGQPLADVKRPEDYINGFRTFIDQNKNSNIALKTLLTKPMELTREHLNELVITLTEHGFDPEKLAENWQQLTHQQLTTHLVGFIRQQALGAAETPFEDRVDKALKRLLQRGKWSEQQANWLEFISTRIKADCIIDEDSLKRGSFKTKRKRMEQDFKGNLMPVIRQLTEEIWKDVS